jgi:hypothetical protein
MAAQWHSSTGQTRREDLPQSHREGKEGSDSEEAINEQSPGKDFGMRPPTPRVKCVKATNKGLRKKVVVKAVDKGVSKE